MTETREERSRRKFIAGALDQAGSVLGGLAGGVTVASVVAPTVATFIQSASMRQPILLLITIAGLSFGVLLLCGAVYCKGLAKQMDDDQLAEAGVAG